MSQQCIPPQWPCLTHGQCPVPSLVTLTGDTMLPGHQNPAQSSSPLHQSVFMEQYVFVLSRFASFLICYRMSECDPGLTSGHLLPVRIGCRARNFSRFCLPKLLQSQILLLQEVLTSPNPSKPRFQKAAPSTPAAAQEANVYRVIFILQCNILITLMDRDIFCQARGWFDDQGS